MSEEHLREHYNKLAEKYDKAVKALKFYRDQQCNEAYCQCQSCPDLKRFVADNTLKELGVIK